MTDVLIVYCFLRLFYSTKEKNLSNGLFGQTKKRLKHSTRKINCVQYIIVIRLLRTLALG